MSESGAEEIPDEGARRQADIEAWIEAWHKSRDEENERTVEAIHADLGRRRLDRLDGVWVDAFVRQMAHERFREQAAIHRMQERDSQYDVPLNIADLWDEDPISPTVCAMADGSCVLYEGARNGIFGPTESGKTMLAVMAMIQEIRAGRPVVYLDFENGPRSFVERLRSFGASKDDVQKYVRYFWVTGALPSPEKAEQIAAVFNVDGGRLVVIDTAHAAMSELGLDTHKSDDVEKFYRLALDPWANQGCAAVVLDHTNKADDFKPYGSERKASGLSGMNLNVVPVTRFSKTAAGYSSVYVNKDRHGGGPEYVTESRLFAELHVIPAGATTDGVGSIELRPLDVAAFAARAAEAEEERAAADAVARMALRAAVHAWVARWDDGDGLATSWATNGESKRGIPRVGGKATRVREVIAEMLEDPSDPLEKNDGGRLSLRETSGPR